MKKKVLFTMLSATLMCAAAAITFAACDEKEATKYAVKYQGGADVTGTAPTEADHAEGEKFKLKDNTFTKEGYEFNGWTFDSKSYAAGDEFTMPAKEVTFTADWLQLFTVTYQWGTEHYEATGVTLPTAVQVANGKTTQLPTIEAQTGYTFSGWKVGTATTATAGGTTYTVTGNVVLTAVFEQKTYNVAYSLGDHAATGALAPGGAVKKFGETVALPAAANNPAAALGYTFNKWEVKQGETEITVTPGENDDPDTFTMPAGDVTITAKWTAKKYTVTFYDSAEAATGTNATYTIEDKLNKAETPAATKTDANGFTVKEWAKKDDANTKFANDAALNTIFTTEDATAISLYPASYHLEFGKKGNQFLYALAAYNATITKGEKVEFSGTMTSAATSNWHTVVATLYSGENPAGSFRIDNFVNSEADITSGEHWTITKDPSGIIWDSLLTVMANCNVKVSFNWVSDTQIIITIALTKDTATQTMVYTIAPSDQQFAASYKLGFGADNSYTEFTVFNRHTHDYSTTTDICTKNGCGQVNPVHTAHQWTNGNCSICHNDCAHTEVTGNTCSACGATLVTTDISDKTQNLEVGAGWNSWGLTQGVVLNNNQDIIIKGTQTATGAAWFSLVMETAAPEGNTTNAGITFRTDSYGWVYANSDLLDTSNLTWNAQANRYDTPGVNSITDNNGAAVNYATADDYWAAACSIENNCDWTVTLKLRDNKLTVNLSMVGKDTGVQGYTFNVTYTIIYKATPANGTVDFHFGADCGDAAAAATVTLNGVSQTVVSYPSSGEGD